MTYMEYEDVPIFKGIKGAECDRMMDCFGVVSQRFAPDDVIYDFDDKRDMIGILDQGSAVIVRLDEKGSRTILERLEPGGVFGEMLMFENVTGDSVQVICEKSCRVWFMHADQVTKRCENACAHHSQLVENMFRLVAEKASDLSERVEVLSRRSIRDKLLCYFVMQTAKTHSTAFTLPFSLSALADYISADRSAMMRELRKMREDRMVDISGRQVTLQRKSA
ncbi:MAG: Crp/Fnr family transcriptional regulator [Clostridiales bacterium]|nr:Crp/Fnr family transcriptional regulator [Clostridiales bacterium]